jgi:hypothetical protein
MRYICRHGLISPLLSLGSPCIRSAQNNLLINTKHDVGEFALTSRKYTLRLSTGKDLFTRPVCQVGARGKAVSKAHRSAEYWIPAFGTVEKVLIRVVWSWKAYSVRAGLDRDEVVVVTCPQPLARAPGHTPRLCQDARPVATSGGVWVFQQSLSPE